MKIGNLDFDFLETITSEEGYKYFINLLYYGAGKNENKFIKLFEEYMENNKLKQGPIQGKLL